MEGMKQMSDSVDETLEYLGYGQNPVNEIYVYVQSGIYAAIFEFHVGASDLDEEGVENVEGFVSLTQPYMLQRPRTNRWVIQKAPYRPPDGLLLLRDTVTNQWRGDTAFREAALSYNQPCVFNITMRSHRRTLFHLLDSIKTSHPRTSFF